MVDTGSGRVVVPGSEKDALPGASPLQPIDPQTRFSVTLVLRRRADAAVPDPSPGAAGSAAVRVTRQEFAAAYGADPEDVAKVEAFAADHGVSVDSVDYASRTVILTGTAAAFGVAFEVDLQLYEHPAGEYRGRRGAVTVPADLGGIVEGVFGLDDRAQTNPRVCVKPEAVVLGAAASASSFTPPGVAQLYNFPTDVTGRG